MKQNRVVLLGSLFFVVVFFSGCGYTKSELAQMDHSGVQVTASFPDWGGNNSKPEIILTFVNPAAQSRKVVLPCPMLEDAREFASPEKPTLVLLCKEASSRDEMEEGFVLAEFNRSTNSHPKVLTLKPGESAQVPYKLTSFYSCGHAGPQKSEGFIDILQPGENEVSISAMIFYSDEDLEKSDRLETPSVVLKCDFPEWMFKRDMESSEGSSGTGNDSRK